MSDVCKSCDLEAVPGTVHYCLASLKAEVSRLKLQIDVQKAEAEKWKSAADALGRRADIAEMNCDTLQANAKRHREERDHYRQECMDLRTKLDEQLRLISDYREALESIVRVSKTPSTVELAQRAIDGKWTERPKCEYCENGWPIGENGWHKSKKVEGTFQMTMPCALKR